MDIRPASEADWPAIWSILAPIMREGETLALPRDGDEATGRAYFASPEKTNFVALGDGTVLGASYVRANQQGGGSHIANCGYVTAASARGKGVARALCTHSIEWCAAQGYAGIQFNFVVSSNGPAAHLWQALGFKVVGRLPQAFAHPRLGLVDALVMFRRL